MTASGTIAEVYGIFQQPWWLDTVAPGAWDAVAIKGGSGEMLGRLPFVYRHRFGLTVLTQPPLTPFLGPWLKPVPGKSTTQFSHQEKVFEALIAELPRHDVFRQSFHSAITNWLPFLWAGFQQTTYYTYRLLDLSDPDRLWDSLHTNVRQQIRKAEREVVVRIEEDVERFIRLHRAVFARQGLEAPYPDDLIRRIHVACRARECGLMLAATDRNGRTHAMCYLVFDATSAYGLLYGSDPELRSSGATTLIVWEAILHAAKVTRSFDFEGSVLRPIERFYRKFGGELTPYAVVFGGRTQLGRVALAARGLLEGRGREVARG